MIRDIRESPEGRNTMIKETERISENRRFQCSWVKPQEGRKGGIKESKTFES